MSTRRTGFLNLLSYIAIIAIGLAITLSLILRLVHIDGMGTVIRACEIVASYLAYFVVACYSYVYARNKGYGWLIAWVVAVVLIIVSLVLGYFFH